jgi:hypothetical protein
MSPFWGDAGGLGETRLPKVGDETPQKGDSWTSPLEKGDFWTYPPKGVLLDVPPKCFCPIRLKKKKKIKKNIYKIKTNIYIYIKIQIYIYI